MGTNYYVEDKHVGKTSSLGRGNGHKFIWAMPPREFLALLKDAMHRRHLTEELHEASEAITESSAEEYDSIGTEFS